jgi:hypothetical protein
VTTVVPLAAPFCREEGVKEHHWFEVRGAASIAIGWRGVDRYWLAQTTLSHFFANGM